MNLTIGSKHFQISLGVIAGGAAALFLALHFGGSNLQLDTWLTSGKQEVQTVGKLLAAHNAYVRRSSAAHKQLSDSLGKVVAAASAQQQRASDLLAQARTVEQLREADRVLAVANTVCMNGLTLCKQRGDSLFRADSAHADSLRVALQAADTTLRRGLKMAQCHVLLLLPCLSRTRSFELGAGLGVIVTLILTHR